MTDNQKIEFACIQCRAVLRLGAEHGGKQARCPNCQSVVPVPLPAAGWGPASPTPTSPAPTSPAPSPPTVAWANPTPEHSRSASTGGFPATNVQTDDVKPQLPPPPLINPPTGDNPFSYAGAERRPPMMMGPPIYRSGDNGRVTAALVLGICGICSNLLCFCGAPIGLILSSIGLGMASTAQGNNRNAALIVSLVGFVISGLVILLFILGLVFD